MRVIPLFALLTSFLLCFSCEKNKFEIKEYPKDQYKPEQVLDFSSASWKPVDTMSIYHYLEDICL